MTAEGPKPGATNLRQISLRFFPGSTLAGTQSTAGVGYQTQALCLIRDTGILKTF